MPPGINCRFRFCDGVTDADGRLYLTTPRPYRFVDRADNIMHVCINGDTLWGLANRYYPRLAVNSDGTLGSGFAPSLLFWVIADFNDINDPTLALTAGRVLTIPSEQTVIEEILAEKRWLEVQE